MSIIDLTDHEPDARPRVGMITRFPPSESGSASAAMELSNRLIQRFGYELEVIRLMLPGEAGAAAGRPVVMALNARWHLTPHFAAQRANQCDVVVVQLDRHVPHRLVEELMAELKTPVVLSVDDVARSGSPEFRSLASLGRQAAVVVVPSETARKRLEDEVSGIRTEVISHGSPWKPFSPGERRRRHILTWGFLAPGMGAERVIRSLAMLSDIDPPPLYRLVGVSDPRSDPDEAVSYRSLLSGEAERLGVADRLEMEPIHSQSGLRREIERSDVIAVVYDSSDRASSRLLSEAVSTGRPVVATAFPGAVELLSSGAGVTVDHDDTNAMAEAFRLLLTDDDAYFGAAGVACSLSASLHCDETARRFAMLLAEQVARNDQAVEAMS